MAFELTSTSTSNNSPTLIWIWPKSGHHQIDLFPGIQCTKHLAFINLQFAFSQSCCLHFTKIFKLLQKARRSGYIYHYFPWQLSWWGSSSNLSKWTVAPSIQASVCTPYIKEEQQWQQTATVCFNSRVHVVESQCKQKVFKRIMTPLFACTFLGIWGAFYNLVLISCGF